jgi:hypothetical protein
MIRESAGLIRLHPGRNSRRNAARHYDEPAPRNTVVHPEIDREMSIPQQALEYLVKETMTRCDHVQPNPTFSTGEACTHILG